jgi:hypothetical protein
VVHVFAVELGHLLELQPLGRQLRDSRHQFGQTQLPGHISGMVRAAGSHPGDRAPGSQDDDVFLHFHLRPLKNWIKIQILGFQTAQPTVNDCQSP